MGIAFSLNVIKHKTQKWTFMTFGVDLSCVRDGGAIWLRLILKMFLGCLIVDKRSKPTDVFAIGFEEMVELNAGNIVNAR